jgi:perosamine synthetase
VGVIKLPDTSLEFFSANVQEIFDTGSLAEGRWNEEIGTLTREYCGVRHAVPTVSNGTGLLALLQLYKALRGRSRVLLQSNTMYGVKTLTQSAGMCIAGYVDCSPTTLVPGIEAIERAVQTQSDKSSLVILLSHIGGSIIPEIEQISAFCRSEGIVLIEDCAHSFGATLNGKHSGTFGDAGAYSFYATKAIAAGEGGIAVSNDDEIGASLADYVKYDRFKREMDIGVNIRPSEVQALLTYAVISQTEAIIEEKRETSQHYVDVCQKLGIDYIAQDEAGSLGNYYKFIVLAQNGSIAAALPHLKTVTSPVYDYCLGDSTEITTNHACLPIWYGQPIELTNTVVAELEMCGGAAVG